MVSSGQLPELVKRANELDAEIKAEPRGWWDEPSIGGSHVVPWRSDITFSYLEINDDFDDLLAHADAGDDDLI